MPPPSSTFAAPPALRLGSARSAAAGVGPAAAAAVGCPPLSPFSSFSRFTSAPPAGAWGGPVGGGGRLGVGAATGHCGLAGGLCSAMCLLQYALSCTSGRPSRPHISMRSPAFRAHIGWNPVVQNPWLHWMQAPDLVLQTAQTRLRRGFPTLGTPCTGSMRSVSPDLMYVSGIHWLQKRWTHCGSAPGATAAGFSAPPFTGQKAHCGCTPVRFFASHARQTHEPSGTWFRVSGSQGWASQRSGSSRGESPERGPPSGAASSARPTSFTP